MNVFCGAVCITRIVKTEKGYQRLDAQVAHDDHFYKSEDEALLDVKKLLSVEPL